MSPTRDTVLQALSTVRDAAGSSDVVAADRVRALNVEGGTVRFILEMPADVAAQAEPVRKAAEEAVKALDGVETVSVLLTAHSAQPGGAVKTPPPSLKVGRHPTPQAGPQPVAGVKRIIAIASGKGGVGKSTVSSNLAVALAAEGKRVGLLDADVYGPSQPRMLGVSGRPASPDGKIILPLRAHGVTVMSIGFMLKEEEAVVWRGPMLMGALQQFLGQVQWGELDVLLVDLPPGTGDVQLTLAQKADLTGAIVVSTPQDIALLDARKALDMFDKTKTPVLGMIENMSTFRCPKCGEETHIFGHGGARAEATKLDLPFLGEIPLNMEIRTAGDGGAPIVAARPDSAEAGVFRSIARRLIDGGLI
ncbi:Mrp/NBP35 family ATP-binding protein [Pontivivens ytuae]|uniref:Iron-sulfur cluster carrier protein n=1 Tax=Pontivivens ytuae TaxID=2789856 RepID=A0A7S9LQK0_9RHOB|nr:Mrp/NBP35 family ATP-binding protein [Pontivivens ytuae]QPH53397.1 Mrp/NBP35 family ATP-binding protein [Pontivivens ytuae]